MSLVVDASVAIKWFIEEDLHRAALDLLDRPGDRHAPDLLVAEVANIAWRKRIQGEIGDSQARFIAEAVAGYFRQQLHPCRALVARAQEIALGLGHPVYDAFYVACAEQMDAVLVTADRRLLNALADTDHVGLAVHLTEFADRP